ncbi:MAG: nicotinate-nucleotide diphosphorylase (carboxylating), partial [Proteobacteria bacterium]|nr:nicotinate-nucleotide diphosphorylase (carboxylating) [Pseudomonadota bacterium]
MDKATLHTCIRSFLAEDIGRGDLTSESIFDKGEVGRARIVARESFVVAGGDSVAAEVFL